MTGKITPISPSKFRVALRFRNLIQIPGLLLLLFSNSLSLAQHELHEMSAAGDLPVTTVPADNEVLVAAPESIMLHFDSKVRLVKLVLRNSANEFVEIGFRYRPGEGIHYMQNFPELSEADYYTVEWAVLDGQGKLSKGSFHFSFGDNARPASFYLEQMDHPQHIMAPDYRLLQ